MIFATSRNFPLEDNFNNIFVIKDKFRVSLSTLVHRSWELESSFIANVAVTPIVTKTSSLIFYKLV